jgi:hypothetical protein
VKRYPGLGLSAGGSTACEYAIRQFVTFGFNQGRIGAFDSYPVVFDFNYYVDAAIRGVLRGRTPPRSRTLS